MPIFADADSVQADLYKELAKELANTPPAIVQEADLTDSSFSSGFRENEERIVLEDPTTGQKVVVLLGKQAEIHDLITELERGEELSAEQLSHLETELLPNMITSDKARLVDALLSGDVSAAEIQLATKTVATLGQASAMSAEESAVFFGTFTGKPERLVRLLQAMPTPSAAEEMADGYYRQLIREVASGISNNAVREYFQSEERTNRELLGIMDWLTSGERVALASELLSAARQDVGTEVILRDKVDNILSHLQPEDRVQLLEEELAYDSRVSFAEEIVESVHGLAELLALVDTVGEERLAATQDIDVINLVAMASSSQVIRTALESISELEQEQEDYLTQLAQLRKILDGLRTELLAGAYTSSDTVRDYVASIDSTLDDIAIGIAESQTNDELGELAELQIAIAKLELQYGVSIGYGESEELSRSDHDGHDHAHDHDHHHSHDEDVEACSLGDFGVSDDAQELVPTTEQTPPRWTIEDIRQIERVLEAIPESDLLFTNMIRDIELVETLGYGVLGARYRIDGKIKIADFTRNNESLSRNYEGEDSLAIVLAHEIGHGLQIADGRAGYNFRDWENPEYHIGEPTLDFDEFLELSGWTVYGLDRVSRGEEWGTAVLDGETIELGVPVEHDGTWKVFQYNPYYGLLTSYDAEADFSSRWYARTSPWEDFAEAFSEYLFLPERLIQDAPMKFLHLEEEFGRYSESSHLQEALRDALETVRGTENREEPTLQ